MPKPWSEGGEERREDLLCLIFSLAVSSLVFGFLFLPLVSFGCFSFLYIVFITRFLRFFISPPYGVHILSISHFSFHQ